VDGLPKKQNVQVKLIKELPWKKAANNIKNTLSPANFT
jgi:hypothetical protein